MMSPGADIHETVAHLDAILAMRRLPERDHAYCMQLRDSLTQTARVAVIGLPRSDIATVRGALLGDVEIAADWPSLPIELAFAATPAFQATLADGTTLAGADLPSAELWSRDVIFMKVTLPLPSLEALTLLCLPLTSADLASPRALAWAGKRCEIAIWCAQDPTDVTPAIWANAPDRLKNYAYCIVTGANTGNEGRGLSGLKRQFGFDGAFALHHGPDQLKPFVRHLTADIDDARQADLDAVHLFLHHRGLDQWAAPTPSRPVVVAAQARSGPHPERVARFSEPILYLKRRAKGLSDMLYWPEDDADWPTEVLAHCCETTDGLRERAYDWPEDDSVAAELSGTIEEACDTAVLLQIEAGPARAEDAAALLLQLRGAFEHALAA